MPESPELQLPDILKFHPKWWIDPVPPWVFQYLRPEAIRELAVVHLELEKAVVEAQARALEMSLKVVRQMK